MKVGDAAGEDDSSKAVDAQAATRRLAEDSCQGDVPRRLAEEAAKAENAKAAADAAKAEEAPSRAEDAADAAERDWGTESGKFTNDNYSTKATSGQDHHPPKGEASPLTHGLNGVMPQQPNTTCLPGQLAANLGPIDQGDQPSAVKREESSGQRSSQTTLTTESSQTLKTPTWDGVKNLPTFTEYCLDRIEKYVAPVLNALVSVVSCAVFLFVALRPFDKVDYDRDWLLEPIMKGYLPNVICFAIAVIQLDSAVVQLLFLRINVCKSKAYRLHKTAKNAVQPDAMQNMMTNLLAKHRRCLIKCCLLLGPFMIPVAVVTAIQEWLFVKEVVKTTPSGALTIRFLVSLLASSTSRAPSVIYPLLGVIDTLIGNIDAVNRDLDETARRKMDDEKDDEMDDQDSADGAAGVRRHDSQKCGSETSSEHEHASKKDQKDPFLDGQALDYWNGKIRDCRRIAQKLAMASAPLELGAIIVLVVAAQAAIIGVLGFTILSTSQDRAEDWALTIYLGAFGFLVGCSLVYLLKQLASIDACVKGVGHSAVSIKNSAMKFHGILASDQQIVAHQSFFHYIGETQFGFVICGTLISTTLVTQVAFKVLLGLPVLLSALKAIINQAKG